MCIFPANIFQIYSLYYTHSIYIFCFLFKFLTDICIPQLHKCFWYKICLLAKIVKVAFILYKKSRAIKPKFKRVWNLSPTNLWHSHTWGEASWWWGTPCSGSNSRRPPWWTHLWLWTGSQSCWPRVSLPPPMLNLITSPVDQWYPWGPCEKKVWHWQQGGIGSVKRGEGEVAWGCWEMMPAGGRRYPHGSHKLSPLPSLLPGQGKLGSAGRQPGYFWALDCTDTQPVLPQPHSPSYTKHVPFFRWAQLYPVLIFLLSWFLSPAYREPPSNGRKCVYTYC